MDRVWADVNNKRLHPDRSNNIKFIFVGLSKVQPQFFAVSFTKKNGTKHREIAEKLLLPNLKTVVIIFHRIFELDSLRKFYRQKGRIYTHSTLFCLKANRYYLLLQLTESSNSGVGSLVRVFVRKLQTKRTSVARLSNHNNKNNHPPIPGNQEEPFFLSLSRSGSCKS